MDLLKFIKATIFCTFLALVYIHMQMNILDNAYVRESQERKVRDLVEANGNMRYAILRFKSANYIGDKLFAQKSDMKFAGPSNVIMISAAPEETTAVAQARKNFDSNPARALISLLTFNQ